MFSLHHPILLRDVGVARLMENALLLGEYIMEELAMSLAIELHIWEMMRPLLVC